MKIMMSRSITLVLVLFLLPAPYCRASAASDLGSWAKSFRGQRVAYDEFMQRIAAIKSTAESQKAATDADKYLSAWKEKREALEKMIFPAGSKEDKAKDAYLEDLRYLKEATELVARGLKPGAHVGDQEIARNRELGFMHSIVEKEADDALAGVPPGAAAASTRWFVDMLNHGERYPALLEKLKTLPAAKVTSELEGLMNEVDRLTVRGSKVPKIGSWMDQSRDWFIQSLTKEHESLTALQKALTTGDASKTSAYLTPIAEYRQAFQKARVNLITGGAAQVPPSPAVEPKKTEIPVVGAAAAKEKEYKENEAMIGRLDKYAKPALVPGGGKTALVVTPQEERAPPRPEVKIPPKVTGDPAGICRSSLSRYPRVSPVMYARCRDANEHSAQAVNVYTYIYKGGMADPLLVSLLKIKSQGQEDCAIQIAKQFAGSMTAAYLEKACL